MPLARPTSVRPLPGYRLYLCFEDGVEGTVDLSDLAGRGVFEVWNEPGAFERVEIGPHGELAWSDELDVCSDSLYLRLTGLAAEALPEALNA